MSFSYYVSLMAMCLAAILMTSPSHAYPSYKSSIPNGNKVQHPCLPFLKWPGVGHTNPLGGGPRNPFGLAFANAGRQWTSALCNADSDGDGKTNGEELGDPSCAWTPGATPSRTSGITHPGYKPFDIIGCFCPTRFLPLFGNRQN